MSISVDWDSEQAEAVLERIRNNAEKVDHEALQIIGMKIVQKAKDILLSKGHFVTGSLYESIRILEDSGDSILVGSDEKHAFWIEFGRGPVRPVNAKVLHWIDPDSGKDVFATYSGPVDPDPFFFPAVSSVVADIPGIVVEMIADV